MVGESITRQNCEKATTAQGVVSFTLQFNNKFQVGAAGQHHPVYVTIQGVRYERTYSLTQLDAQAHSVDSEKSGSR